MGKFGSTAKKFITLQRKEKSAASLVCSSCLPYLCLRNGSPPPLGRAMKRETGASPVQSRCCNSHFRRHTPSHWSATHMAAAPGRRVERGKVRRPAAANTPPTYAFEEGRRYTPGTFSESS